MKAKLLVFYVVLLMITSCTLGRSSVLSDNYCTAPCWDGIVPGETSLSEDYELLGKNGGILPDSISKIPGDELYWSEGLSWEFVNKEESNGRVYFHDKKTIFLAFTYEDPVILGKYLNLYGNPDEVRATKAVLDGVMINVELVYKNGICINLVTHKLPFSNPEYITIGPNTKVNAVFYFDPNLSSEEINNTCYWPINTEKIQSWKGYGKYKLLLQD